MRPVQSTERKVVVVILLGGLAFGAAVQSADAQIRIGGDGCPDFTVLCPMVYDPVICDDGNTYFNLCAATYWGCATGCESTGGGVVFLSPDSVEDQTGPALDKSATVETGFAQAGAQLEGLNNSAAQTSAPFQIGGDGCPNFTVLCPAVYDPVICDDGNTYSNLCVATYWGCATGCESTGGGIVFLSQPSDGADADGGFGQSLEDATLVPHLATINGETQLMTAAVPNDMLSALESDGQDANTMLAARAVTEQLSQDFVVHDSLGNTTQGSQMRFFPIGGGCPDFTVLCPAVYDPVICDDGNTYSNLCVATYWGCATGCESTGGGIIAFE